MRRSVLICIFLFLGCDLEDPTPIVVNMADEYITYDPSGFNREALGLRLQMKVKTASKRTRKFRSVDGVESLPESVSLNYQLTLKSPDQQHAGACKTFSNTASIEAAYFRKFNKVVKFSELWELRLMIGEALLRNQGKRYSPAIYLGLSADEILWWARHAGLCSQDSLPYTSSVIERFDSQYRQGRVDVVRMIKDFHFFRNYLYTRDTESLKNCIEEAKSNRRDFYGFQELPISPPTKENIMKWLSFGVPVYYVLRGTGSLDELAVSAPHAVLLTGYNKRLKAFYFRNSWGPTGQYLLPTQLRFDRVDRDASTDDFGYLPTVVISDADIRRACGAEKNSAPSDISIFCDTLHDPL